MSLRPALFLDRDGVVNTDIQFLHRIEDTEFMPGIFELTRHFAARGYAVAIASNQSGIGRGLYSEAIFARFMAWMRAEIAKQGGVIDATYYAPTHPSEGVAPYRRVTGWRKPGPVMFLRAAADLALDLGRSAAVGNQMSDVEAARAAGIGTLFLLDGKAKGVSRDGDYWIVPALADIAALAPA
jgi:D-glycero-D-manno-heptose 1,7-bisphosphate phosphatase